MTTPGYQQVSPGQTVQSSWGNTVWNQTLNRFASSADRVAQWANPPNGAIWHEADSNAWYGMRAGVRTPVAASTPALLGIAAFGVYNAARATRILAGQLSATTSGVGLIGQALPAGLVCVLTANATAEGAAGQRLNAVLMRANSDLTTLYWQINMNETTLVNAGARIDISVVVQ